MAFEKFKKAVKNFIWADHLRDNSIVHQYVHLDEDGGLHVSPEIMNTLGVRRQMEGALLLAQIQREQHQSHQSHAVNNTVKKIKR